MFSMTYEQAIANFQNALVSGWVKPDDIVCLDYWSFDDVLSFIEGDDYYKDVTTDVAREVWGKVAVIISRYENVDNDVVRDEISSALDEWMEGK